MGVSDGAHDISWRPRLPDSALPRPAMEELDGESLVVVSLLFQIGSVILPTSTEDHVAAMMRARGTSARSGPGAAAVFGFAPPSPQPRWRTRSAIGASNARGRSRCFFGGGAEQFRLSGAVVVACSDRVSPPPVVSPIRPSSVLLFLGVAIVVCSG
jgi:hypothetical protein